MNTQKLILTASISLLIACADQVALREVDDVAVAVEEPVIAGQHAVPVSPATKPPIRLHKQASHKVLELHSAAEAMAIRPALADAVYTRGMHPATYYPTQQDRENYQQRDDNPVKRAQEEPLSTFSIDVDTAGYSNVRRMLSLEGRLPPANAVRTEEMLNYFSYDYPLPEAGAQPFSVSTAIAPAPWNEDRYLLQVGLKGYEPNIASRPAANLVFLVDVSGSMQSADKLELVKKSLRLLVNRMTARDTIALAVYAGAAGMVLEPTSGNHKAKILAAIDGLTAGGSTNGGAGIQLAYTLAEQQFIQGGINRVIIASDGDMNVGTVNLEALKNLVAAKRKTGIALTTLGFGRGNYNDALMEQLADVGDGNAAYIDSLREANKVLVHEMQFTLLTIARDVKIQIEFNPSVVAEYRLIGYQNRILNREDFVNDKIDAGEIGAGHTVTALYELALTDARNKSIPVGRYSQTVDTNTKHSNELAFLKLRYKLPENNSSSEFRQVIWRNDIEQDINRASNDLRFASAVVGFSDLLRGGHYIGDWSYGQLLDLARSSKGDDQQGYRGEFIGLVELAQSLSGQ